MSAVSNKSASRHWDGLAVLLSGICLFHCLLLPGMIVLFPILGATLFGDREFHQLMLYLVLPISVIGLGMGFRRHRRLYVIVVGAAGLLILIVAAWLVHPLQQAALEILVASIGGTVVAASHILNYLACRQPG